METVTLGVRVFAKLGIKKLILTNAAGGIREDLNPGSIMLISDHIGAFCPSALRGPNLDEFGPRFKDMTEVYSKAVGDIARSVAAENGIELSEGVYIFFRGPMFETPAEIRAFRTMGADAVGMSTVPEAIVAAQCGIEAIGISCSTNMAAGILPQKLNHQEVMETAAIVHDKFHRLLVLILQTI